MKIKVGIVGASDTVDLIKSVGYEFNDRIDCIPLSYKDTDECIEIVKESINSMDAFLFSGSVPYELVTKNLNVTKPCMYIPRNSSCIYKLLWEIRNSEILSGNISMDTATEKDISDIHEILKELNCNELNIFPLNFRGVNWDYKETINEHYNLWREGKSDLAVTAFYSIYLKLKELGMPVIRITLTKDIIRKTIEALISNVTNRRLKANQVGVIIINIESPKELALTSYENQKLKLKLSNIFLDYAQAFHGCYFPLDTGDHVIFTTRGSIVASTNGYKSISIIDALSKELTNAKISCGIGYGKTSNEAEVNAKLGLSHARENGGDCAFVIGDEGSIRGPIGKDSEIEYSYSNEGELLKIAEDIGISTLYVSKLKSISEHIGKNTINSKELAYYLSISERSARRILKLLSNKGYAEDIGEEAPRAKGRPRILYKINL